MEIRRGIGVSGGYAIGEALVIDREEYRISRRSVSTDELDAEIRRLERAAEAAETEIRSQVRAMPRRVREVAGAILEAQIRPLQDVQAEIREDVKKNLWGAEYAISRTMKKKVKALEDAGAVSPATQAYAVRIIPTLVEIEKSLIRHLLGSTRESVSNLSKPVIIVAHDLSPGQTVTLDRFKVLGILTEVGGPTSHTAIVAKSLGIPAVVGVEGIDSDISGGDTVVLDGSGGTVITNPDEATLKRYQAMERNFELLEKRRAKELQDVPAVTKDGTAIEVFANIETPDEIPTALEHGAQGVGLYRTEFLYLTHGFNPTEKNHVDAYQRAVGLLGKRRLVIRTMDLGADKVPVEGLPVEENPFLGTRAIRLCFEKPEVFRIQLRAILRVAPMGNVEFMLPMITSLSEILQVKELVEDVRRELQHEGERTLEKVPMGIMVEVPAAALITDMLAPHVDFFSVGTNDLIAYSVAVDRRNERVAPLYQPGHPAILRLLKYIIEAAGHHKKPISVCGEMSSDITYTPLLLGLGLRRFSVAPPVIPDLKKMICSLTIDDARAVAERALSFDDARTTVNFLRERTRQLMPDTL